MSAQSAALIEPLATALAALDGLELTSASRIAVIGLGPIGLLTAYAAMGPGGYVVGIDPAATRRNHAVALGVAEVLPSVDKLTSASFDAVIDAVGVSATSSAAVRGLSCGGVVVVVGLGETTVPVDIGRIVRAGLTVRGTYAYKREHFTAASNTLTERPLSLSWVECLPLGQGADAFERLATVDIAATKVLLEINS
jgi:threonine dehydrogenase-like Zn-dependent dehydrogenase